MNARILIIILLVSAVLGGCAGREFYQRECIRFTVTEPVGEDRREPEPEPDRPWYSDLVSLPKYAFQPIVILVSGAVDVTKAGFGAFVSVETGRTKGEIVVERTAIWSKRFRHLDRIDLTTRWPYLVENKVPAGAEMFDIDASTKDGLEKGTHAE